MIHLALDPAQPDWTNYGDSTNVVRLIGLLIPIVTALITKRFAAAKLKSAITLLLSAITGSAVYLVASDGHGYNWAGFVNAIVNAYLPAIVSYYGFWKPTEIEPKVAAATEGIGLGSNADASGDHQGAQVYGDNQSTVVNDAGYATLGTLGAVLVLVAVILLILTAIKVFVVAVPVLVLLFVLGIVLWFIGGRTSV